MRQPWGLLTYSGDARRPTHVRRPRTVLAAVVVGSFCSVACLLPKVVDSDRVEGVKGTRSASDAAMVESDEKGSDTSLAVCDGGSTRCSVDFEAVEHCNKGHWIKSACDPDTVCRAADDESPRACVSVEPACVGHAGAWVCTQAGTLILCNVQNLAVRMNDCGSRELCHADAGYCDLTATMPAPPMADSAAGAAGSGGSAAVVVAAECMPDQARCIDDHAGREQCRDGTWQSAPCKYDQVCIADSKYTPGTCFQKTPACIGYPGKHVCDSAGELLDCSSQEVLRGRVRCESKELCQEQEARCLVCIEGTRRCMWRDSGYYIERCTRRDGATDAQWMEDTHCADGTRCELNSDPPHCV